MKHFFRLAALAATLSLGHMAYAADAPAVSDEELVKQVKLALDADPELKALDLKITSNKSEVTIDGQMTDDQQMLHAGQVAEKVPGVKFVINNMTLKN